jgi:DNA primase
MKTDRLFEEIKSKIDIVDFISSYVQLKKSGQNWKGICPFHPEKTPSFTVSQAKQIFHCFGCGAGGDIIAFAVKYENLSFHEAVDLLAKKAGIPLTGGRTDKKSFQKHENIREALSVACDYFAKKLDDSGTAGEYLKKRGISGESIDIFRLGYAPPGWDNLLKYLRSSGCSDIAIREAGLAVSGDRGLYDMFRNRMIFPITSVSGNVLAFGGRALDDSLPKYINSPETAVYKKSDTLFGLHTAKEEIRQQGTVLIVEGYMDVIICHQFGFKNVVAPLGTALTSGHIQRLRPLTNRAVLVFDGDAAGKAAAKRTLPLICRNNYKAKVLLLPDNEDPDSYLRKYGDQSFIKMLDTSKTMIDFMFSISTGEKTDIAREVLELIAEVRDLLMADEMLRELSDRTRINENALREEFSRLKNRTVPDKTDARPISARAININREEYLLLSAVIAFPEKSDYVLSRLDISDFKDKTVISLFRKLSSLGHNKDLSQVLEDADKDEREMVTGFSVNPGFDLENVDRNIEDCIRTIEKRKLDERRRLAEMSGDLKLMNDRLLEKRKDL